MEEMKKETLESIYDALKYIEDHIEDIQVDYKVIDALYKARDYIMECKMEQ